MIADAPCGHDRRFAPRGLWKPPDPRTRKRPRAHRSLDAGKRPPAPTATTGRGGQIDLREYAGRCTRLDQTLN